MIIFCMKISRILYAFCFGGGDDVSAQRHTARYAEGYVVSPGSFERDQDGSFVSVVHDYQAHAWPEIYIENVGWVPFEVTPAYENNEIAVPDQLEGETSESESESSTAQSESESETESQSESETVSAQTQSDPGRRHRTWQRFF